MKLVSDISLSGQAQRMGRPFDLASLFANGEQGVWFDPSDATTLFQDSAGTIPVTAPNQSVGRILDKSGNGLHATQPVAAARPTYRRTAQGQAYLEFDGVDDWLSFGPLPLAGKTAATVCVAMRKVTDAATGFLFSTGTWAGPSMDMRVPGSWGAANFGSYALATGTATQVGVLAGGYPAPMSAVVTFEVDFTRPAGQEATLRINQVSHAQTSGVAQDNTGTLSGSTAFLGRRQDAPVMCLNGHIHGFVLCLTPPSAKQRQRLEFTLSRKIGTPS